jgi:Na+/H+ antiporter NhaD/arsenite permease-like protein
MESSYLAQWISAIVFIVTFVLIISERVHRTVIAMGGAVLVVLLGHFFNFYSPELAFEAIDFHTLTLLAGMMIIVAVLEHTGFLEFLAIKSAQKAKGNPWLLLVALGTVTTLVSFILDNVTTVVIIAPVTILIAKITRISATPLLMAEALLSDTGGVATLVGDPPNVMIGSAAHFSFNAFITHVAPIVLVAWAATLLVLKFVYRKELKKVPDHIDDLMNWDASKSITNKGDIYKTLSVLVLVVALFFCHHYIHLEPSMVAIIGATLTLLLVTLKKDPQPIMEKVEWSVLAFFIALFVLVGALEHSGIIDHLTRAIVHHSGHSIVITALIILWVSAFASAIIDNIPFTMAMIPVIHQMGADGIETNLLWWALALGVGFGGNGSPIGSTANVVVVSKSADTDEPITFLTWFKSGTLATLATCIVASVAIILFHEWLAR